VISFSAKKRSAIVAISLAIILLVFSGISSIIILNMTESVRSLIEKDDAVLRFEKEYGRVAVLSMLKAFESTEEDGDFSFIANQSVLSSSQIEVVVTTKIEQPDPEMVISFIASTQNHPAVEAIIFK